MPAVRKPGSEVSVTSLVASILGRVDPRLTALCGLPYVWPMTRTSVLRMAVCGATALGAAIPTRLSAQSPLIAQVIAGVDSLFTPYAHSGSPGCAVGVFRNGAVAFARGYGFANLTNDVPITPSTRFTVGSVSKQFTAASIALLVRAGKLSLDDDVRKYVPELTAYPTPITIRHLVHHTSGMRDFWELVDLASMRPDDGYGVQDMLALATRQHGLNFTPGAEYRYSNTGYLALGIIVQRITGQSLRRFADSAIFAPLGMRETFFLDDHNEIVHGRAVAYSPTASGWRVNVWNNDLVGQGGVVTTLADLQKWDENFYDMKLGGRAFVELVQSTDPLNSGAPNTYAFGLQVESYRGRKLVQHTGATGGYRAAIFRFPEEHTSMAMLCNASDANTTTLSLRMADLVLQDVLAAVAPPTTVVARTQRTHVNLAPRPAEHAAIVGRYRSTELNDVVWEISAAGAPAAVQLTRPRHPAVPLATGDSAMSYGDGGGLRLRFDGPVRGLSAGFQLNGSRVTNVRFVRIAAP